MLLLALVLALALLGLAALAVFGLPWLLVGDRAVEDFEERSDQKVFAGLLGTAFLAILAVPVAADGLIFAAQHAHVFAETVLGVPARFWS